MNIKLL